MLDLTFEDLQLAVGAVLLAAFLAIRVQRALFNLLADPKSSGRRLF